MKKIFMVSVFLAFAQPAVADIGFAFGINITFYGDIGVSAKALTSDKHDETVFAVGATYYPFSDNKAGFDIGLGRTLFNGVILWGIDLSKDVAYFSLGYHEAATQ